jgi:peptide/nickel transport system permease protein
LRIVPGDPAIARCGLGCTDAQLEAIREELGLNKSYPEQYWDWMGGVLTGDLGEANFNQRPVLESIKVRLPVTIELMVLAMVFTIMIGIPAGIVSAIWRNGPVDYVVRVVAVFGLAVPVFWVATLAIILPVEWWGYAPPLGVKIGLLEDPWGNFKQMAPAAAVLAIASSAGIMRLTRSSLLEVMRQDYIRTARAKGVSDPPVVWKHALKNAAIPIVTIVGIELGTLLGGSVITETIFAWPGVGRLSVQAIYNRDYPVVQAAVFLLASTFVLVNLLVDVAYTYLDPRIRLR